MCNVELTPIFVNSKLQPATRRTVERKTERNVGSRLCNPSGPDTMASFSYLERRSELKTYFDRTAVEAWARLTTDAPVSGIRATVRAGRDQMRATLLGWLPDDLHGRRILDAGCGTGALAVEAARRGADVTAIDLSPTLVNLARERTPRDLGAGSITYIAGDMLDPPAGRFDHVVSMDSLIHYEARDVVGALSRLADRTDHSILFTVAPRTPALMVLHTIGLAFPRSDRAPAIVPVRDITLYRLIMSEPRLQDWRAMRSKRVSKGFYKSEAFEIVSRLERSP
jgi:magnesium-protoporphyrin O-methyltransferase